MFSFDSYKPTLTGPFMATGETKRRAQNDAMALGDSQSVARAVMPQMRGVQAGRAYDSMRAGMESDARRNAAQQAAIEAFNQYQNQDALANLQYEQGVASEVAALAELLNRQAGLDYSMDSAAKDRAASQQVFDERMKVSRELSDREAERARINAMLNIGLGVLGMGGLGQSTQSLSSVLAGLARN